MAHPRTNTVPLAERCTRCLCRAHAPGSTRCPACIKEQADLSTTRKRLRAEARAAREAAAVAARDDLQSHDFPTSTQNGDRGTQCGYVAENGPVAQPCNRGHSGNNVAAADSVMVALGFSRVESGNESGSRGPIPVQERCPDQDSRTENDQRKPEASNLVGRPPVTDRPGNEDILREENRELLAEVTRLRKEALTEERVRRELLHLADAPSRPPDWLLRQTTERGCYGVPTLFLSDQHLGEVVDPAQIGGVNKYDMEIARVRWRRTTEKAVDLCHNFLARPQFDGVVLALGGDGVSGNIHEELLATNEEEIGPVVLELADLIVWSVRELRKAFGRIFVPCVIGNHARMSAKPRAKGAAFTSFDWLAYQLASRSFTGDEAVSFCVPSGTDAAWRVYGHRYLMTHGAQFRGGDGIIGPLGPIFRGDQRKRSRNAQVGAAYDTLMVAHFHQLAMERRIIRNGSLKGYDEYAFQGNFPFEPPQQGLWLTHPTHGITFSFPVMPDDPPPPGAEPWVSVRAA